MENYLMINGKKIELTPEQAAQLCADDRPVKAPKRFNPAERKGGQRYYAASPTGVTDAGVDSLGSVDDTLYGCANYWNDKAFAKQVALSMLLYRKLLQYAYLNDCVDDKPWDDDTGHVYIAQYASGRFMTSYTWNCKSPCVVYFKSEAAANKAIEEVVEPFMEEHSDFRVIW
jgi:hypothetical protein